MYQVAAPIWNQVAKAAPLKTQLGRSLFHLNQDQLNRSLAQREKSLSKQGVPLKVATAFLTVAPLLWEHPAIAKFKEQNPQLESNLPDLADSGEATVLATKEFGLTASQQKQLQTLLQKPPT